MPLVKFDELLSVVMWLGKTLIGILVINTLTMLTIAPVNRGKPTLKDDERPFRYGLSRDLKMNAKMNANINAKSMPLSYSMSAECQTYKAKHKICVCKVDYNVIIINTLLEMSRSLKIADCRFRLIGGRLSQIIASILIAIANESSDIPSTSLSLDSVLCRFTQQYWLCLYLIRQCLVNLISHSFLTFSQISQMCRV